MLLQGIFGLIFGLVKFIIYWLPQLGSVNASSEQSAMFLIKRGLMFFPADLWVLVITNIVTWTTIFFAWSIIEWIYKKIPGVN